MLDQTGRPVRVDTGEFADTDIYSCDLRLNILSMRPELFLICYWNSFVMDTVESYHE